MKQSSISHTQNHPYQKLLWIIIALSFIPAAFLLWNRISYEQSSKTTALVMDYNALSIQAKRYGKEPQELLTHYQKLGINGVAIYEDTIGTLQQNGQLIIKNGYELLDRFPNGDLKSSSVYMNASTELLETLSQRYTIPTRFVEINHQRWLEWPVDPTYLPAGPNKELIDSVEKKGLFVVYRPYHDEGIPLKNIGSDWPAVPFIAFTGDEVIGARTPELLSQVSASLGNRLPAIIEGNIQKGLDQLVHQHGGVRLFALSPQWQFGLDPLDVASKYNLAARERSQRLLYVRPYPTINETETMLTRTTELLQRSGIILTKPDIQFYRPADIWQYLSLLGPLAALLLLGLSIPLRRLGLLLVGGIFVGSVALNGFQPVAAGALLSAVTFPALGFVLRRGQMTDWFFATALSLMGVVFVSALGATFYSTLGLEPFRGVGLTLLLPLLLVAVSFLPRQDIRQTVSDLYHAPIKLGDVLIMALGLGLLLMVFERRGNATGGTPSQFETDLRRGLQDNLVRPRFKEVGAHPLALLGLGASLPTYFSALLIVGGVMGQASILNTFSHFHTPFLISATRCFLGLAIGLAIGYILTFLLKKVMHLWKQTTWHKETEAVQ